MKGSASDYIDTSDIKVDTITCNGNLGTCDTIAVNGLSSNLVYNPGILSTYRDYNELVEVQQEFLDNNKEEISEYLSICWYMEKIKTRLDDIRKALTTIENEHIDIDESGLRLKAKQLIIELDGLKRRQFIIASTRPDIIQFAMKTANLNLQAVDLYPYERLSEYAKLMHYTTNKHAFMFNLKSYTSGHYDDPGPTGASGPPGPYSVYVDKKFL